MELIHILTIIAAILLAIIVLRFLLSGTSRLSRARVDEKVGGGRRRRRSTNALRIKDLSKFPRSKSEASVIAFLEQTTGREFPTAYPDWLIWRGAHLELDGYNEELHLALEFSGPFHTKWTPKDEPYVKYFERVVRDVVKRRLCAKHGVKLIVVDCSLPRAHWHNYVLSRLHDVGYLEDRPVEYIAEQTAEPFRNDQLEQEMGLHAEMNAAKKI